MAAGRIILPCMPALDSNGRPVSGALLNFYENNTTTRKAVYTTADLNVALTNPVVADAAGAFPSIFADEDELYSVTGFSVLGVMLPKASYSSVRATTAIGDGLVVVSSFMQTVLDDTTEAAARTTLGAQKKIYIDVTEAPFNAKGDGVTNDTAAIIAACATGKRVLFPKGVYIISSAIPVAVDGTQIIGEGRGAVSIYQTTANAKVLNVTASDVYVEGVALDYTGTPVAGATAIYSTGFNNTFTDFRINRCWEGVHLLNGSSQIAFNFQVYSYGNAGVRVQNCGDPQVYDAIIDAVNTTNGADGGLVVEDFVEAGIFSSLEVLNGVWSLKTKAASFAVGARPAYCRFLNVYLDSSQLGSSVDKLVASSFVGGWSSGGRSGAGLPGMTLLQTDSLTFTAHQWMNSGGHGCLVTTQSVRTTIVASQAFGNSVTAGDGISHGIATDANVQSLTVANCTLSNILFVGKQGYGLALGANCTDVLVAENRVSGNFTGPIFIGAGVTGIVRDNVGYNPVGGSTITVGASPFTYTAGPSPETVYIRGGTVSDVATAGFSAFVATNCSVSLGPGEGVSVTYTVAPTMNRAVH